MPKLITSSHRFAAIWRVGLCLLVGLLVHSHTSHAQAPKPRDAGANTLLKEAERLYLAGIKLAQKNRFSDALAKFRASYRIVPSAKEPRNESIRGTLHLLIGRTYHRMKSWQNARDHYRKYLAILKEDKRRSKVLEWLKSLRPHLEATLRLASVPEAACVVTFPGGQWRGTSPATIKIESGGVTVRCVADEFKPITTKFTIPPKSNVSKSVILTALPKPPPPPKDLRWVGLVIGGVGLATLGAGGLLGGLAMADNSEAIATRDAATNGEDSAAALRLYSGAEQKAVTANVLYAVGGGLAITGVILYFVLRPRSAPPKRALLPRIAPSRRARAAGPRRSRRLGIRSWQGFGSDERFFFSTSPTQMARP